MQLRRQVANAKTMGPLTTGKKKLGGFKGEEERKQKEGGRGRERNKGKEHKGRKY
jgi:hypothetical protein